MGYAMLRECARKMGGTSAFWPTFSGTGMGFRTGFFSGSADSLCLTRFVAEGEEGSSVALRLMPGMMSVCDCKVRKQDDCEKKERGRA